MNILNMKCYFWKCCKPGTFVLPIQIQQILTISGWLYCWQNDIIWCFYVVSVKNYTSLERCKFLPRVMVQIVVKFCGVVELLYSCELSCSVSDWKILLLMIPELNFMFSELWSPRNLKFVRFIADNILNKIYIFQKFCHLRWKML